MKKDYQVIVKAQDGTMAIYKTDESRKSAIKDIEKCIDALGKVKNCDFGYIEYRTTLKYLNLLREILEKEGK